MKLSAEVAALDQIPSIGNVQLLHLYLLARVNVVLGVRFLLQLVQQLLCLLGNMHLTSFASFFKFVSNDNV